MDREAWCATVHGVAKSWTRLSDWAELSNEIDVNQGLCMCVKTHSNYGSPFLPFPPSPTNQLQDLFHSCRTFYTHILRYLFPAALWVFQVFRCRHYIPHWRASRNRCTVSFYLSAHPVSIIGSSGRNGSSPYCSRNRDGSSGTPAAGVKNVTKNQQYYKTVIVKLCVCMCVCVWKGYKKPSDIIIKP